MCFIDVEESVDRVQKKVLEFATSKGIPDVWVRSVMSLYLGAKTRIMVDSELSEEFEVNAGMHQGSVLSPIFFALVVDVVTVDVVRGCAKWVNVC